MTIVSINIFANISPGMKYLTLWSQYYMVLIPNILSVMKGLDWCYVGQKIRYSATIQLNITEVLSNHLSKKFWLI